MASARSTPRDDRVLAYTRVLSLVIVPFLVVAILILYPFPGDTDRLFAWTIQPTMTPMLLASAYAGGAYFFMRVQWMSRWTGIKAGFPPVVLFASLLGIATVLHWDRFNHSHVAFWIWTGLYFVAPFLVLGAWLANRTHARPPGPDEVLLPVPARWVMVAIGSLGVLTGAVMFLAPAQIIPIWPWLLTPLTCRVVGAVFCLASAGLVVLGDGRWLTVRLMMQVAFIMVTLILLAAVRARSEFDTSRPLTWLMLVGFVGVLVGTAGLWYVMEIRPRRV
jgi:hypothetical protein